MESLTIKQKSLLTEREIQYLALAATGCSNKIIAEILFVSNSTVKKTFEKIFLKINAKSRANAVAIALIRKIITPHTLFIILEKYKLNNF